MQNLKTLLMALLLIGGWCESKAQGSFRSWSIVAPNGVSHNGAYVVGNEKGYENLNYFTSFRYEVSTGTIGWPTYFDENDYDQSGKFATVTNTGIIIGAMKDKDMLIAYEEGEFAPPTGGMTKAPVKKRTAYADNDPIITYLPAVSAAVWRNDKTYNLGMGLHTIDELGDESDGSYAVGGSEDGGIVAGYIQAWWLKIIPCIWTYEAISDTYKYQDLPLPEGFKRATTKAISADGKVIVGEGTKENSTYPILWTSTTDVKALSINNEPYSDSEADAVSANGRYILIHGNGWGAVSSLALYDTTTGKMEQLQLPNAENIYQCKGLAVTNEGDCYCTISYNTDYTDALYFYDKTNNTIANIDYYLSALNVNITGLPSLTSSKVSAVSSDGKVVVGNDDKIGGWVLTLSDTKATIINAPEVTDFFFSSYNSVTVKWEACKNLPAGVTIGAYKVYIDGQLKATVAPEEGVNGVYRSKVECSNGSRSAYVEAIAMKDGKEINTAVSTVHLAYLSEKNDLPLFDNFDESFLDGNGNPVAYYDYWTAKRLCGDDASVIKWSIDANNYENSSPYMCTISIGNTPWESALYSPFITTDKGEDLFVSFYTAYQLVNTANQNLSTDYLYVDYSTDGEHWTTVKSICAGDIAPYSWRLVKADIDGDLSGKPFQLRFRAHGEGNATLKWNIDCICLNNKYEGAAPAEVKAVKTNDGKVKVMWQNSLKAYELSRLGNTSVLCNYCIGSEGVPLITAVDLKYEDMIDHVGEYITAVSAFIFDNPDITTDQSTMAEAIIYANGKEVSKEQFTNIFNDPSPSTVTLSQPVKIEADKSYRIAVRIFDYDVAQTPVYYSASEDFVPGATDLYSEDEGVTWHRLSDVFAGAEDKYLAKCIWPIRAHVSSQGWTNTDKQLEKELLGYNVYRNGEQLNDNAVYAAHPFFIDEQPVENVTYSVRAFYKDGRVSDITAAADVLPSAITAMEAGEPSTWQWDDDSRELTISGNANAVLYDSNGKVVGRATATGMNLRNLSAGIYLLRISQGSKETVEKIIIK